MNILEALICDLKPPKSKPVNVTVGLHWTAVKSKYTGMAHTYKTNDRSGIGYGGKLANLTVDELADMAFSWNTLEASVGCAAINSLIKPEGINGNVELLFRKMARNKTVSIIGRFPFNDDIRKIAKKCYVLEMDPDKDEYPHTAAENILPKCDVNLITATALINHTLDRLLELGCNGTNIVLGPTTPLSETLFGFGAHILAGVKVTDCDKLVASISQGVKKFRDIGGIQPVYMIDKSKKV